ncbi:hypothetical protein EYS14_21545 [Alteromonadaceae bacterium M269]|nr:hypothetical protein EYS14_21545 [Alteromonadaceae bacterium M269]
MIRFNKFFTLTLILLMSSCNSVFAEVDYHYQGSIQLSPEKGHMIADWSIDVLDPKAKDITFFLRDTLNEPVVSGDVNSVRLEKVSGFSDFWSVQVTLNELEGEQSRVVNIDYKGVLLPEPLPNGINQITADHIELNVDSFWFPMDASFSKLLTADLNISVEGDWFGITTGDINRKDEVFKLINADPRLDIAFNLSRKVRRKQTTRYEIFDVRENDGGIDRLIKAADACITTLNRWFGKYQLLPQGKFVVTERKESGYARENYIVFTDITDTPDDRLTRFVCHELGHFWASGADFNSVENWLNEGFAEYIATRAAGEILGADVFDAMIAEYEKQIEGKDLPPIWTKTSSARSPYLVNYRKSALALYSLENDVGAEKFMKIVSQFYASDTRTTPTLLSIVEEVAGEKERLEFEAILAR